MRRRSEEVHRVWRCCASLSVATGGLLLMTATPPATSETRPLPLASAQRLPRWRGFNLPYRIKKRAKANTHLNKPFTEKTFRLIAGLGFNFVRIPLDYHYWIVGDDWDQLDEQAEVLSEVDSILAWGEKYGIHVCLNFHTAPGYCINDKTPEGSRLWDDPEAQRVCAKHWAFFAQRYRGVPNERLSFNLYNEPARTEPQKHLKVTQLVVAAIRAEDPDRLILCDGFQFKPAPELIPLGVAQAARGYTPGQITHYKASWWSGSDRWETPVWPRPLAHGWLAAPSKQKNAGLPLILTGPFPAGATLRLHLGDVFSAATLVLSADGKEVWRKELSTGPEGAGEWKATKYWDQWKQYQSTYDCDCETVLPAARELRLENRAGNWVQVTRLTLCTGDGAEHSLALDPQWGSQPDPLQFDKTRPGNGWRAPHQQDRDWLQRECVQPWIDLANKGVGVMVGEFGVYNKTPHDVTLAFLEDCLKNYQQAGFGWALWNFDGPFGVVDSDREDVDYEDWEGHKLDRKMLELLQRY